MEKHCGVCAWGGGFACAVCGRCVRYPMGNATGNVCVSDLGLGFGVLVFWWVRSVDVCYLCNVWMSVLFVCDLRCVCNVVGAIWWEVRCAMSSELWATTEKMINRMFEVCETYLRTTQDSELSTVCLPHPYAQHCNYYYHLMLRSLPYAICHVPCTVCTSMCLKTHVWRDVLTDSRDAGSIVWMS